MNFVERLLKITAKYDCTEELLWTEDLEFSVFCSDVFYWATVDAEGVTENDLDQYEQALKDGGSIHGPVLYCARKRGMRPQHAYYKSVPDDMRALFDACGPERKAESR